MKYIITQLRTIHNDFHFSISIEKGIQEEKRIDAKIVWESNIQINYRTQMEKDAEGFWTRLTLLLYDYMHVFETAHYAKRLMRECAYALFPCTQTHTPSHCLFLPSWAISICT